MTFFSLTDSDIQILSSAASVFFFFNDTATTEIYTLSLHDALPISHRGSSARRLWPRQSRGGRHPLCRHRAAAICGLASARSEEHTSELQSLAYLVCRLLLEKKKYMEQHINGQEVHEHA